MRELLSEGKIKVSELSSHPKNDYYFDDMEGDAWDSLLQSISTSGVTNAITITKDKKIISGHQRVRACKVLGIEDISYKMIEYENEAKEIKDLIESNLRQRVLGNTNPVKLGRCFEFLNEYYGFTHGGDRKSKENNFTLKNEGEISTQTDLADSYGITKQTMNNYMRLANMIPELEELVDTGIIMPTTALAMIKALSEDEQRELISSLDITEKITKTKLQSYIEEIRELKSNKTNSDSKEKTELKERISLLESQKRQLETKVKLNEDEANRYKNLKSEIEFLIKKKTDLGRQIESATELASLTVKLQKLLENELAPIKFKRCMEELNNGDVAFQNLSNVISLIDTWSMEMKTIINTFDICEFIIEEQ